MSIEKVDLTVPGTAALDNLAWHALTGPHRRYAQIHGIARRYRPDVAAYSALPAQRDDRAWADLVALNGPGTEIVLSGAPFRRPAGWEVSRTGHAVQMTALDVPGTPDPEAVVLGPEDVPEMTALIERTQPGPWRPNTVNLGLYLGIRRHGRLVAMAGERVRVPGWTEVSAVCTDPDHRGQGLAGRLVGAVVHHIRARGDQALLHTSVTNTTAQHVYEKVGFRIRRETVFVRLITPGG